MSDVPTPHPTSDLVTRLGCPHVFAPVKLALGPLWEPGKLLLALAALIVSAVFTAALDSVAGPVGADAVAEYAAAHRVERHAAAAGQSRPVESVPPATVADDEASSGIFAAFFQFEVYSAEAGVRALFGATTMSSLPPTGASGSAVSHLWDMLLGLWWLASRHTFFTIVLSLGLLAIWALPIGAISRMAAEAVCTDYYMGLADAVEYARPRCFALFVAPLMPFVWITGAAMLLWFAGLALSIPIVGDLLAVIVVPLSLIVGVVLSFWLVALLPAAVMSWPALVVDGADPFEAATSRGVAYAFSRLIKSAWYAFVLAAIGGVTTLLVRAAIGVVFVVTHAVVSAGAWLAGRELDGVEWNKLDVIWPLGGADMSEALSRGDVISSFFVKVWTVLAGAVVPAYAAAYAICALTVWYLLMRRDVDGVPVSELSPRSPNA